MCFGTEGLLDNPTPEAVARLLNLDQASRDGASVDVLIVGGGPGGVAAAVYAGAEGLSSMLVEELAVGGQAGTSSRIENYLGFPTGISGSDLVWRGEIQAMKFGTQFVRPRRVVGVEGQERRFAVTLNDGNCVNAGAIVVATGVQYRRLHGTGWLTLKAPESSTRRQRMRRVIAKVSLSLLSAAATQPGRRPCSSAARPPTCMS